MKVIRSFRSNLIIRGTDIYIAKSKSRSIERLFSYTRKYRFPLCYPLRQNGSPRLAVLQSTFGKKRGFYRKGNNKDSPFHIRWNLCFPLLYPLQQNGSPRLAVLQCTFHKKRGYISQIKAKIAFHIHLNFVFPYGIPSVQKVSPRLNFLQGAFHKKRGFCEKRTIN